MCVFVIRGKYLRALDMVELALSERDAAPSPVEECCCRRLLEVRSSLLAHAGPWSVTPHWQYDRPLSTDRDTQRCTRMVEMMPITGNAYSTEMEI